MAIGDIKEEGIKSRIIKFSRTSNKRFIPAVNLVKFGEGRATCVKIVTSMYLSREGISVDAMLGAHVVLGTIMDVELLELVSIGQGAPRDVDVVLRVFVNSEDQGLAGVLERPADFVLVEMNVSEERVEEQFVWLDIDRRLSSSLVAQVPLGVDQAPKPRT